MKLSKEQSEHFDREGYLFFPSLFSPAEVKALLDEVPALYAQRRADNVREKGSYAVRTNFAAHMYNRQFAKLARHPRMVEPIRQLFGEAVYMHQFKVNGKLAFDGDVWQWHQDYGTWARDDGMPEPRAMNIAVFLDEVMPINGPLMLIPRSQAHGNLVHGSAPNITPYPRKIVYLTLNAVSNHIRKPTRPEWIAHTDFAPIQPVPDDALTRYARRYRQAAE